MIRGKGIDPNSVVPTLLRKNELEVQELRCKLNIALSEHIQTEEVAKVEKEKEALSSQRGGACLERGREHRIKGEIFSATTGSW